MNVYYAESQGRQYQRASGEASSVASNQEHGRLIKTMLTNKSSTLFCLVLLASNSHIYFQVEQSNNLWFIHVMPKPAWPLLSTSCWIVWKMNEWTHIFQVDINIYSNILALSVGGEESRQ